MLSAVYGFFKLMKIYTFFEIEHSNMRIRYLFSPSLLRIFYDCFMTVLR